MKKRIIALILSSVTIMFTFAACSSSKNTVLNISGAEITSGVYSYFYDYVSGNKKSFKIGEENEKEAIREKVTELLKEYVAVNTMADKLGVTLSYNLKAQEASDTDSKWDIFGKYYSEIGISKQDLNKVIANSSLKSALLEYYYGEDSKVKPTSTEKLKKAFAEKYVGINVIAASLTTTDNLGNTVQLNEYESENIQSVFNNMKNRLNSGADIDTVYNDYITNLDLIGTQSLETYVMTKDSVGYGEDFFKEISSLGYNKATVLKYEDTIYLFYRVDISGDDLGYFITYKYDVLEDLRLSSLEKKIASQASKYEIVKEHSRTVKKIEKAIDKKRAA